MNDHKQRSPQRSPMVALTVWIAVTRLLLWRRPSGYHRGRRTSPMPGRGSSDVGAGYDSFDDDQGRPITGARATAPPRSESSALRPAARVKGRIGIVDSRPIRTIALERSDRRPPSPSVIAGVALRSPGSSISAGQSDRQLVGRACRQAPVVADTSELRLRRNPKLRTRCRQRSSFSESRGGIAR